MLNLYLTFLINDKTKINTRFNDKSLDSENDFEEKSMLYNQYLCY
jgi:hypothetical protein